MNPCPFCGNAHPIVRVYGTPNGTFTVIQCSTCFAQGPRAQYSDNIIGSYAEADRLATHKWNERTPT
jgi:Lar family restriction alleviation protein